jgi:hypothetical protein
MSKRTLPGPAAGGPVRVLARAAIGAALIVTLGAAAAPAAGAQADAGTVTNFKFALNAVSVLSPSDAWAVGDSATVLHWNGTSWAPVTIPGLPAAVSLSAVDALSSSDVWAAGFADAGTPFSPETTLIVHWNGTAWKRVSAPGSFKPESLSPSLPSMSMDSATDGWAVGSVVDDKTGANTSLALHWNGTSWQRVTTSPGLSFSGVTSFSPSNAAAVGTHQTSEFMFTPVAFHWNGTSWKVTAALPAPPGVSASQLAGPYSLSAPSATDMWTVGGQFTSTGVNNLAWHWNGTRWTVMRTSLVTPDGSGLTGVTAISPANVWAVGFTNTTGDNGNDQAPVSVHWNGTSWTRVTTPDPIGPNSGSTVLNAVSNAGPGNIWAVGHYAHNEPGGLGIPHTLILRWNGTRWVRA